MKRSVCRLKNICMFLAGRPCASPRGQTVTVCFYPAVTVTVVTVRDLDASKRSRDVATPKKRMLGPTPSIFCRVDAPKTHKQVLATPKIFIYMVGAKDDKNNKGITFLSDIKSDERAKRAKQNYVKSVPGQADKKGDKKHEQVFM